MKLRNQFANCLRRICDFVGNTKGSEWNKVLVVLDIIKPRHNVANGDINALHSSNMNYTAVTRAKESARVISSSSPPRVAIKYSDIFYEFIKLIKNNWTGALSARKRHHSPIRLGTCHRVDADS